MSNCSTISIPSTPSVPACLVPLLALLPTGNLQGDYQFLSLVTGFRLSRHRSQELPIADTAIARVGALAKLEKQPLIQARGPIVERRRDHPVDFDAYDNDFDDPYEPDDDIFDADDYSAIDADELANIEDPFAVHVAPVPQVAPPPIHIVADQGAQYEPVDNNNSDHEFLNEEEYPEADDEERQENNEEYPEADDEKPQEQGVDEEPHKQGVDEESHEQGADEEPHKQGAYSAELHEQEGAYNAELDEQEANIPAETPAQPQQIRFSLRNRTYPNSTAFKAAMDAPHNSKSYFPQYNYCTRTFFPTSWPKWKATQSLL